MRRALILCIIAAALVFPSSSANAADDTTDPILTDFTLTSSASIDTGASAVSFAWTATVTDNLSGVRYIVVYITAPAGMYGNSPVWVSALGDQSVTRSGKATLPQYMKYGTYDIYVAIGDHAGNWRLYQSNVPSPPIVGFYDLCAIDTPCKITNAAP
ncbi:MAG: hypothetical protein IH885_01220 [Myxococcales bacterium]|nr:hypothetical protein [Myxococcales bacterium]